MTVVEGIIFANGKTNFQKTLLSFDISSFLVYNDYRYIIIFYTNGQKISSV